MSLHVPTNTLPLFAAVAPKAFDGRPEDPSFILAPSTPLERRFADFHRTNPQVYRELNAKAVKLLESGRSRIGIAELVEELRYDYRLRSEGDAFKLNNTWRAFYSRLLVYKDLRLDGVIELREQTHVRNAREQRERAG